MPNHVYREVRLAARPRGPLTDELFEIAEVPIPAAAPGQVLVRTTVMSVAAAMRTLLDEVTDMPMPSYVLGEPLSGPALGEVQAAPGADFSPGDLVQHRQGWREYALLHAAEVRRVDADLLPDPAAYLSQGSTAWMGVVRGAEVRPGDTVFVSGAAGGVGSLAGQVARLRGAERLIGSTGSQRKANFLIEELGYDAVVIRGRARSRTSCAPPRPTASTRSSTPSAVSSCRPPSPPPSAVRASRSSVRCPASCRTPAAR